MHINLGKILGALSHSIGDKGVVRRVGRGLSLPARPPKGPEVSPWDTSEMF